MWLADPRAAGELVKSILWGVPERYELFAYTVLGNHVHVLLKPLVMLEIITQGIKGVSAFQINRLQQAKGRTVWQDESYDHWTRDEKELSGSKLTKICSPPQPSVRRDCHNRMKRRKCGSQSRQRLGDNGVTPKVWRPWLRAQKWIAKCLRWPSRSNQNGKSGRRLSGSNGERIDWPISLLNLG